MSPICLLPVVATGLVFTLHFAKSDDVMCYEAVNENTGECEEYLGDGVSKEDCCLNRKYGFRREAHDQCQSCRSAEWTDWGSWSLCSVSCEEGVHTRRRICLGQGNCTGNSVEVKTCMVRECCPENGGWSIWSLWSPCSATCKTGQTQRTRQCNNPRPICGGRCNGPQNEVDICETYLSCPIHGQWGTWGPWQGCSSTCKTESGTPPIQKRFRLCNNPEPSHSPPGNQCDGNVGENRVCDNLPFCAVDGEWGAWRRDSECSVTCAVGRVKEKRFCDSPSPRYGGRYCEGSNTRNTICNTKVPCPVDGQWTEWGSWSKCSRLENDLIRCRPRVGTQARKRKCDGTSPDGKWCEGDYRQSRTCYDIDKCMLNGTWSEWSSWGLCSSPCGRAERTRHRECLGVYPDYPEEMMCCNGHKSIYIGHKSIYIFRSLEVNGGSDLGRTDHVKGAYDCFHTDAWLFTRIMGAAQFTCGFPAAKHSVNGGWVYKNNRICLLHLKNVLYSGKNNYEFYEWRRWAEGVGKWRNSFKLAATDLNPSSAGRSALEGFFPILQTHFITGFFFVAG